MDNESYRIGFEAAMELCLVETRKSDSREIALAKMQEFLNLVKDDKMDRLKEALWNIKR